jgi:hopanoid-associated phosphorylase
MARAGIVAALHAEARSLECGPRRAAPGATSGGCLIRISGIGRANARRAAQTLVDAGVAALASWGYCGGLDPQLACGTLVLPETVVAADGTPFRTDPQWRARLLHRITGHLAVSTGIIVESTEPVADVSRKQALFERSGAAAVDMESAAIAEIAVRAGIPFVAIRVVVDAAQHGLPRQILGAVDAAGSVRPARLAAALAASLQQWPGVFRTARDARIARRTLRTVRTMTGAQLAFDHAASRCRDLVDAT